MKSGLTADVIFRLRLTLSGRPASDGKPISSTLCFAPYFWTEKLTYFQLPDFGTKFLDLCRRVSSTSSKWAPAGSIRKFQMRAMVWFVRHLIKKSFKGRL